MKTLFMFILSVVLLTPAFANAQAQTNSAPLPATATAGVQPSVVPQKPSATNDTPVLAAPESTPLTTNGAALTATQALGVQPDSSFLKKTPELTYTPRKANEINFGPRVISGIAVQVVKAKNPLQLLSPAAPPEYGSGVDNISSLSGTGPLLKVLSISF
jgi:hypothetical protein